MKKIFAFFVVCSFTAIDLSLGAVNVKKAAPVQMQKQSVMDSTTSFLPTVLGLVEDVKNLKTQQQQLTAECEPSSDEIETVNELVKEWAKIGDTDSYSLSNSFSACSGTNYAEYMTFNSEGKNDYCFDTFSASGGYIWDGYPKASKTGKINCTGNNNTNCKVYSNVYEVFAKIPFSEEDYTERETRKIAKLKEKAEKCSDAKVNAAKRELYGGFLTKTLSGVGKTSGASGTEAVLNAVSSMGGSGSLGSLLPSLSGVATQMLDK